MNEIQVSLDPELEEYTKDLSIDFDPYRQSLVLLGNDSGC
jgi:hypothetical protein